MKLTQRKERHDSLAPGSVLLRLPTTVRSERRGLSLRQSAEGTVGETHWTNIEGPIEAGAVVLQGYVRRELREFGATQVLEERVPEIG